MTTLIASKRLQSMPQMTRRCIRYSSSSTPQTLQDKLRHLMVHCAQPVAIVTTRLRQHQGGESKDQMDDLHEFHGATISSFSSIAMHPYPLVAFSLQLPSRLASALHAHTPTDTNTNARRTSPHFVINLLSTHQKDVAHRFSRPDLYPFPLAGVAENGIKLTKEDQPMLLESVGCISCAVVHSLRLDGPAVLGEKQLLCDSMEERKSGKREGIQMGDWNEPREAPRSTSELFIARVIRLETLHPHETGGEGSQMPLVYFRKHYTTAAPPETSGAEGKS
jgi:flavin reductase (DIM6/NTAB) family NADH-FMN oxidoreductase RutF